MNSDKVIPALCVIALLGVLTSIIGVLFGKEILMTIGAYIVVSFVGVFVLLLIIAGVYLIFWGD